MLTSGRQCDGDGWLADNLRMRSLLPLLTVCGTVLTNNHSLSPVLARQQTQP